MLLYKRKIFILLYIVAIQHLEDRARQGENALQTSRPGSVSWSSAPHPLAGTSTLGSTRTLLLPPSSEPEEATEQTSLLRLFQVQSRRWSSPARLRISSVSGEERPGSKGTGDPGAEVLSARVGVTCVRRGGRGRRGGGVRGGTAGTETGGLVVLLRCRFLLCNIHSQSINN